MERGEGRGKNPVLPGQVGLVEGRRGTAKLETIGKRRRRESEEGRELGGRRRYVTVRPKSEQRTLI